MFSPSRRYGASRRETWKRVCFILPMNSRRAWASLSKRSKTVLRAPILLKRYKRTRQNLTEIVGGGGEGPVLVLRKLLLNWLVGRGTPQSTLLPKYLCDKLDLCFFHVLYFYMRNFCILIGLEQWYFNLI